jgi:hypothetical protein
VVLCVVTEGPNFDPGISDDAYGCGEKDAGGGAWIDWVAAEQSGRIASIEGVVMVSMRS